MKRYKKLLSLVLSVLIIILSAVNVSANSVITNNNIVETVIDTSKYTIENIPDNLLNTVSSNIKEAYELDLQGIEDNYSFTINNKDGTKTLYRFETPIKYKDGNKVLFKNPKLQKINIFKGIFSKYSYETVENDVKSYFPQNLQDGILMEYQDYSIKLSSHNNSTLKENELIVDEENNIASYKNVFTSKDRVEYTPIANGLKENIVLEEYTGQNTFSFIINIGDLMPAFLEGESIPLLDKSSQKTVMVIGQVDAKDSYTGENENNDTHFSIYNSLKLEETDTENEYVLTVTVDKEFLESETTVYPVVIDPTINATDISRIYDTTVYSGYPNSNTFYSSAYNVVGDHGSTYGQGIAFIQTLYMHRYKYIRPFNITYAYYHVREGSGKTNSSVIELYNPYSSWEDTTITYNNMPEMYNYNSYNITVNSSQWYNINITGLVRSWLSTELSEGGWNQTRGFALKAQDPSASSKHFCSANHATYPPSLVINYVEDTSITDDVYYIKNVWTGKYLDVENPTINGDTVPINVIAYPFNGGLNQQWRVEHQGNGYYKLYTEWEFYGSMCLNVTGDNINVYNDGSGEQLLFRIIKNKDNTYRIMPISNANNAVDVNGNTSSSDYGKNVINYAYFGNTNQKWEFIKADFGSAPSYVSIHTDKYLMNCAGFALRIDKYIKGTDLGMVDWDSVQTMANKTVQYFNSEQPNRTIRIIEGVNNEPHYPINSNEYRVALCVREYQPNVEITYDYHYMIQTSDGTWAHKLATDSSELLGYINPSTYSWPNGYDSDVIYFAVSN